mmetsp:Transcript_30970/g.73592  ORF Transcript_30970/g.73592 Transcript_30970/m.73592 type:complete len:137 (-) Transcript_30970:51-461(-)
MRMPAKVSARRGEANTTRPDPRAMEAFSRLRKQITKLETLAQMLDRSYEQMLCRHMSMDIKHIVARMDLAVLTRSKVKAVLVKHFRFSKAEVSQHHDFVKQTTLLEIAKKMQRAVSAQQRSAAQPVGSRADPRDVD